MFASLIIFGCNNTTNPATAYLYPELCTRKIVSVGERFFEYQNGFMHSPRTYSFQGMEGSTIIKYSLNFVQDRKPYHINAVIDIDGLNKGTPLMVEDLNYIDVNGNIYYALVHGFLVIHSVSSDRLEYTIQESHEPFWVLKTSRKPVPCAGQK